MEKVRRQPATALIIILVLILLSSFGSIAYAKSVSKSANTPLAATAAATSQISTDGTLNNTYWGIVASNASKAASNVAALNKALEWASQNGIRKVKLKKATYYVDGQHDRVYSVSDKSITIPSNISFDLGGSTLTQVPNDKEGYAIFTIIGSSNVTLSNGKLVGDKAKHKFTNAPSHTHEYGFGIDIRGGIDVTISKLDIYNMTGDSILIGGKDTSLAQGGTISENVTVSNCKLHDNRRQGLSIMGARNVSITGCTIYNIGKSNGTNPSCGIDLENELDWPIESVRIYQNKFYNNKKAAVMVHRGTSNTLIQQNNINGYVALVYGERTTVESNTIANGGIYAVDTSAPLYSYINKNTLSNANIEVLTNKGAVISNNTIKEGVIKLNYASGALYNNKITNKKSKIFAVQVYADAQVKDYTFNVYLYGNETIGKYTSALSVSNYANLKVYNDQAQTQKYIDDFSEAPIPQGVIVLTPNYTGWIIVFAVIAVAGAAGLWFLIKRKKAGVKPDEVQ
ncbi:MAG: right-handed parallel beta-helix repeat-containing protein [Christensenellales bacterium]